MNLVSGEIREIFVHDGVTMAKVSVGGAMCQVPVLLLPEAKVGDFILIEAGVAISTVEDQNPDEPKNPIVQDAAVSFKSKEE